MKKLATGIVLAFLLATLFSAPWMYQAWAVGNCSVFRTWNTGDSVTASDLNSSFTTAAVTNSTPQCLDDYSATVSQMQATTDPYASGTESQATSTAGEIERLRFMFKQIFGLTQWYRHDQAPTFSFSHMNAQALHLSSTGVPGGTDDAQNRFLARFPVLTGPDHWTGIWWPHNTAHMAFSFRDYQHANGGVQGGIELYRFHAEALTLHHTVTIRFRHSALDGSFPHVTALAIDSLDRIVVGHAGVALILHGASISGNGGTSKALFLGPQGHVYVNSIGVSSTGQPGWIGLYAFTPGSATQKTFTVTAHSVVFMNASTHALTRVNSPTSATVDLGTSGPVANGWDRGSAVPASAWVHVYAIYNGSTFATTASPSGTSTGPNLPTGYTSWAYVGPIWTDSDTDLRGLHIAGTTGLWTMESHAVSTTSSSSTPTQVNVEDHVPTNATRYLVFFERRGFIGASATAPATSFLALPGNGTPALERVAAYDMAAGTAGDVNAIRATIPNIGRQLVYWDVRVGTGGSGFSLVLSVRGFTISNGAD